MRRKSAKSGKRWLASVLGTICLAIAAVAVLLPYRQALLVTYWEAELARVPDDRVADVIRQLAMLDEPGVAAVARALGSPRNVVSQSAYEALSEEITACAKLPPLDAQDRLSALAASLAAHADERSPAARGAAARLAVRLLLWPAEMGLAQRSQLVANCERVLEATGASIERPQQLAHAVPKVAARHRPRSGPAITAPHRTGAETLANMPTATLTVADFAPPPLQRADTENLSADPDEPGRFDDSGSTALAHRTSDEASLESIAGESVAQGESLIAPARHEPGGSARPLKGLDMLGVFGQLHESDEAAAEAAAELRARGLTIRQIEVGMHLTSPDAHERRQWTEYLPGIRGVSAKAWLLHLSRDENVGVRRAAVNLLATSGDPEMQRRVAEVARQDSDADLRFESARAAELIEQPSAYTVTGP